MQSDDGIVHIVTFHDVDWDEVDYHLFLAAAAAIPNCQEIIQGEFEVNDQEFNVQMSYDVPRSDVKKVLQALGELPGSFIIFSPRKDLAELTVGGEVELESF